MRMKLITMLLISLLAATAFAKDNDYPEAKGFIEELNHESMIVSIAGQRFYANSSTKVERFDTHISFADLQVGDYVELEYDPTRVNNALSYAAKIEVESASSRSGRSSSSSNSSSSSSSSNSSSNASDDYVELIGRVSNVDKSARLFKLGNTVISAATVFEYKNQADDYMTADAFWLQLEEGQLLKVEGDFNANIFEARELNFR